MSEYLKPESEIRLKNRKVYSVESKKAGTTKLLEITIPSDTRKKNKETGDYETVCTTWFKIKLWGDKAEEMEGEIGKGDVVTVTGRYEESFYKKKDGTEGRNVEIAWPEIEVLQKGKSRDEDEI
jgi:single-stranded DNA-binding protein